MTLQLLRAKTNDLNLCFGEIFSLQRKTCSEIFFPPNIFGSFSASVILFPVFFGPGAIIVQVDRRRSLHHHHHHHFLKKNAPYCRQERSPSSLRQSRVKKTSRQMKVRCRVRIPVRPGQAKKTLI